MKIIDGKLHRYAYLLVYGCQMNQSDAERMMGQLRTIGYERTESMEEADLILINTCCVRETAEDRVYGKIGEIKRLKRENPELIFGITGCMAQKEGDALIKRAPHIDFVLGTNKVHELTHVVQEIQAEHGHVVDVQLGETELPDDVPVARAGSLSAWVPIMYGCNNFCTYCIVPYVRGREKSRKPGDILAEFRSLVEAGYKEITLLGQNVNSYGKGLEEQIDFSDLLNLLCTVPGDYHIRFMTSHPKDASHKLIDTIAAQPKLCKHLHLPVQCGSDRLLQQMNRHYTVEQYLELIDYARKTVPGITFSSDIIVGFPGETEEDFVKTLELVRKVGYMQLFTFIYSKRTGTKAAEMPDPTPRKEKTDRMTRLLATQDEIAMALVKAQVGQTVRVLVEGYGRNEGTLSGRLDNNLTVEFAADPALLGSYATVHLTGARATVLLGEVEA